MKTVKQQTEVSFQALDFTDKVVMLPLMNLFAASIRANIKVNATIDMDENMVNAYIAPEQAKKIFKVLSDLGCRTSLGESYEDIIKSDNSQRKTILSLRNPGECKLEIVKILKEQLNIGPSEAKNLVDACPTKIDLDNYSIPTAGYEYLLNELIIHGAMAELITKEQ